jgi:hypothetical protein
MIFFTLVGSIVLINSMLSLSLSKEKTLDDVLKNDTVDEVKKKPLDPNVFARLDSAVDVQEESTLVDNLEALKENPAHVSDDAIVSLLEAGKIAGYALEKTLQDFNRAVKIRRRVVCMFLI